VVTYRYRKADSHLIPLHSFMVLMPLLRRLAVCGLALSAACHLEDRTPEGSRRDEAQIREVIVEYYRGYSSSDWGTIRKFFAKDAMVSYPSPVADDSGRTVMIPADSLLLTLARSAEDGKLPPPEARIIRADLRQAGSVAAVWITVHQTIAADTGARVLEDQEHWVLRRTRDGWRAVLLTLPWTPR
jgi:ketosteroid isomerase-like protein